MEFEGTLLNTGYSYVDDFDSSQFKKIFVFTCHGERWKGTGINNSSSYDKQTRIYKKFGIKKISQADAWLDISEPL